ncbi:hypothetical protein [Rhizobium hainanense]|nr:hypothetical protein [Rhizobium hainanense]
MSDTQSVETLLVKLVGQPAWQVQVMHGNFLSLDFGKPWLDIAEKLTPPQRKIVARGEWHFVLRYCQWRVFNAKQADPEASRSTQRSYATREISGQFLRSVTYDSQLRTTKLVFDLGAIIEIHPNNWSDDPQWLLSGKDQVWTLDNAGHLTHEARTLFSKGIDKTW